MPLIIHFVSFFRVIQNSKLYFHCFVLSSKQCHTQRRTMHTRVYIIYKSIGLKRSIFLVYCSTSFSQSVKLHITCIFFQCLINLTERNALAQQQQRKKKKKQQTSFRCVWALFFVPNRLIPYANIFIAVNTQWDATRSTL